MPGPRIIDIIPSFADPKDDPRLFATQCRTVSETLYAYSEGPVVPASYAQLYVTQSGAGGGGTGSEANPLTISTVEATAGTQLEAIITAAKALVTGGVTGVVLYLHPSITARLADDAQIVLDVPFQMRRWNTGSDPRRPLIHKWRASLLAYLGNPTLTPTGSGSTVYYTATGVASAVNMAIAEGTPSEDRTDPRYRAERFVRANTLAAFVAIRDRGTTNCWAWVGTEFRIYLTGGRDPAGLTLQCCTATEGQIEIDADKVLIEGLHLSGGDQRIGGLEHWLVQAVGDGAYVLKDCVLSNAFKHIAGHATGTNTGAVGLSWGNIITGGHADDSGYTHLVAYADNGDNDLLSFQDHFEEAAAGPLRVRAQLIYTHRAVSSPGTFCGSVVLCSFTANSTGWGGYAGFLRVSDPAASGVVYGCVDGTVTQEIYGAGTVGTAIAAGMDGSYLSTPMPIDDFTASVPHAGIRSSADYFSYPTVSLTAVALVDGSWEQELVNWDLRVNFAAPTVASDRPRMFYFLPGFTGELLFRNSTLTFDYAGGTRTDATLFYDQGGTGSRLKLLDSAVAFAGTTASMSLESLGRKLNANPLTTDKGCSNCAFLDVPSLDRAATLNPVVLTEFDPDEVPAQSSDLSTVLALFSNAGDDYPERDAYLAPRSTLFPAIGARSPLFSLASPRTSKLGARRLQARARQLRGGRR